MPPSMRAASRMPGLLHAWLPKEAPCILAEGAGTTSLIEPKPGVLRQNWICNARFCLALASCGVARQRAVKRGYRMHQGLPAAKPDKASAIVQASGRTRMTKGQLLRRLQDHASSKSGLCLADSYLNNKMKVQWECEHGHRWHATPDSILNAGRWCPQCAVERRRGTLERMQDHARKRGGKLLSTKYTSSRAKYLWQCKLGHTWEALASSVVNMGTWCPQCGRKQKVPTRRSLQDLQENAASRGGRCLATEYCGVHKKVPWECKEGHTWHATPNKVLSGNTWCAVCARCAPIGLERLRKHAAQRGGECLATEYVNAHSKVAWKCKHGHVWEATLNQVLNHGQWCPHCRKIGLPRLQAHAASLGGRCLAKSYKNSSIKLLWECREGHRWQANANNVMNAKTWCPTCATSIWRTEAQIRDIFQTIFCPSKFESCYPQFLEGLQLDGYCAKLSLAFEYQGEQHYDPENYFHFGDISSFEAQQERDARKVMLCKAEGVRLVLVPYFVTDKKTFVVTALLQWFFIGEIVPTLLPMQSISNKAGQKTQTLLSEGFWQEEYSRGYAETAEHGRAQLCLKGARSSIAWRLLVGQHWVQYSIPCC